MAGASAGAGGPGLSVSAGRTGGSLGAVAAGLGVPCELNEDPLQTPTRKTNKSSRGGHWSEEDLAENDGVISPRLFAPFLRDALRQVLAGERGTVFHQFCWHHLQRRSPRLRFPRPVPCPAPNPRATTSRLCSITITVEPLSTMRSSNPMSPATSGSGRIR